jgi:hypothetical protein
MSMTIRRPLDFDDPGACDDDMVSKRAGIQYGHIREWHDELDRLTRQLAEAQRVIERQRKALEPFAKVGEPFIAAAASGAFPAGASARFMKLEPLTVQEFINAAHAAAMSTTDKP